MHTTARRRLVALAQLAGPTFLCLAAQLSTAAADSSDLAAFLERAEKMATFSGPVRADIRVLRGTELLDQAVVVIDPAAGREFLALRSSGWRALMPLNWSAGKAAPSRGGKLEGFGPDQPLPRTDLRAIDFFPFWDCDYRTAFISDSTRLEKTVTLYARKDTPYVLFVITFDKEKLVPLTLKFYKDSMNNLVRLRRDSDFVMVGSRPRPRRVDIQDFVENTSTTLELAWRALESVPSGLIDEASFPTANLDWATEPVVAR